MKSFTIKEIKTKDAWESNIGIFPKVNFLQSWNWGEFQERLNKKVGRLIVFKENKVVICAQYILEDAKRGRYLAIAGGPIVNWKEVNVRALKLFIAHIKKIAKNSKCIFVRVRLQEKESNKMRNIMKSLGFIVAPMHLTADLTSVIDLTDSEEELLKNMRKSTRYEIRKSYKENLKVLKSDDPKEIESFYKNQLYLAKKHGFIPFSYNFLLRQFESFLEDNQVLLIHCLKDDKLLASAYIIFYNKEAVYHYGVSTPENNKLPGSYRCQWEAIKEAKRRECDKYNLWGVSPAGEIKHRFAGVSIFKRGFGGEDMAFVPAMDLPTDWRYIFTWVFEKIRKSRRHL